MLLLTMLFTHARNRFPNKLPHSQLLQSLYYKYNSRNYYRSILYWYPILSNPYFYVLLQPHGTPLISTNRVRVQILQHSYHENKVSGERFFQPLSLKFQTKRDQSYIL